MKAIDAFQGSTNQEETFYYTEKDPYVWQV